MSSRIGWCGMQVGMACAGYAMRPASSEMHHVVDGCNVIKNWLVRHAGRDGVCGVCHEASQLRNAPRCGWL